MSLLPLDTVLEDYRGRRWRLWAWGLYDDDDPRVEVAVLVEDVSHAVFRDRPRAGVRVVAVPADRLRGTVLVDDERPPHRRRVPRYHVLGPYD